MGGRDTIYYDGRCGLCHRAVRFALERDRTGRLFRFAPLQSERFRVVARGRPALNDSIVVVTADGRLLDRSDAVLHILDRLGTGWRGLARIGRLIPRPIRDAAYNVVARVRSRLFPSPPDLCPSVPPELRHRFNENPEERRAAGGPP